MLFALYIMAIARGGGEKQANGASGMVPYHEGDGAGEESGGEGLASHLACLSTRKARGGRMAS